MKKIDIYAHRGGAGLLPENSLLAFSAALAIGVDVIDMDVVVTKDEVVTVYHDLILNPAYTSNAEGNFDIKLIPLRELNFAELVKYDIGQLNPRTPYAKVYPDQLSVPHTRIPSLEQAIQHIKKIAGNKVRLQIELKRDPKKPELSIEPKRYAELVNAIIVDNEVEKLVEIHSFDWPILVELGKLNPKITTTFISAIRESTPAPANLKKIVESGGKGWCPDFVDLNSERVEEAHSLGLRVVPWTVDQQKEMIEIIDLGVDGIITNRPDILRGLLAARGFKLP